MRVCLVVESGTDVRLVEGLAARCDLSVLARTIPGATAISQPTNAAPVHLGPASRARFSAYVLRTLRSGRDRYERVIVQGYGAAALAASFSDIPIIKLVCSPTESYYRCRRLNPDARMPYSALAHRGLVTLAQLNARRHGSYVVLSRYLASVVRGHGARGPVHVVPVYGVDTARFRPATISRSAVRAQLGLPVDGQLLFHSSRVAPEKDAATVIAAVARLVSQGRDVRLLHRSGGWRRFAELASRAGLADRVIATDAVHPVNELPASYHASDLVVQASFDEGLGFSVLEALACGTPVAASAVGGLKETVIDGKTGWSVMPRDAGALADAIAAVLDDPAEAARRTQAGRAMVEAEFARDNVFDRFMQVVEDAA